MAANTHLIDDKETNNWFKAVIGLKVTKEGLTNFLCAELQKVHTVVGRSCGNCPIENLIQCPTNPYCNNRKRNYCPFHKSQKPQPCPICDNVKDNIILHHRYGKPSWRNTRAEKWAQNDWEIGKCYLPPDGYSSISSMQESDFNGVINIMLNCLHFQTCLSPLCLSPPPPDKQCPLEKVRQIGRDVRHTSDCKVTDADLQDYFKTLSTLLADPQYLQHDPSAIIACTRLSDLQNARMSFEELGKLLKEANHTLEDAKKAGECFSEKAERTLEELEAGLHQLKAAKEDIVAQVKKEVRDFKTNGDEVNYSKRKEILLDMMIKHYDNTLSTITTSPLHDGVHARVDDIYMPPKLQLMEKVKGAFKKTDTTITKYNNVLLKDGEYNRKMFIQGEAGSGKSTFLAILVRDWCCINSKASRKQTDEAGSGKSTFLAILVRNWCCITSQAYGKQKDETYTADANARLRPSDVFEDLTTLKVYTFVFHVTLRDSVNELNILEMLKKQIIDSIYGDKDRRENAYRLLNEIMERERCLVLLDGLDEWTCNEGRSLPVLAASHSQCDVLITTRPWKLTEAMIPDAKIDILLQLEGVNKPFEFSRRLLGCIDDCKDSMVLDKKQSEFESYIMKNDLKKLLISPMLLQLIVLSWVAGTEMNGSMCEIYSLFLESLLKKANKEQRKFQSPPVQCFKDTEHIRPNIKNVDRLAKAAFHLLFSNARESSLVFSDTDLERFGLDEEHKEFAFKSGILSATRKASALRSSPSYSFSHKSIQEFLAAYYIACNTHQIDDIISGYLNRYKDAYMDISQVFIFLCGLQISAAKKLSGMMNERDVDSRNREFPSIILSGFREAVANKHYDSNFILSHFYFNIAVTEIGDVHNIWIQNTSNILSLDLTIRESQSSYERGESASHYEFDLSSCSKLKSLRLLGKDIWFKEACGLDKESVILDRSNTIVFNTEAVVHELSAQTLSRKQEIELATRYDSYTQISNPEAGVHEL
ncbi:uncharacterized protein LOC127875047 [Dreissena polymorpha]|uniref:uncharacterized protein LOC127875047 n=1 Tax=Dreissena polymorpha TaxID=45954 RepID=UPI002264E600|nr:uncharacterized protein LOC127875047 [Dreissena polymorpha]